VRIYFNPPDEVKKVGRTITGNTFVELIGQLQKGECLIGLYDRGAFKNALVLNPSYVDGDSQYVDMKRQMRDCDVTCEGYFAVKLEDVPGLVSYNG
jgi:hypothetical protein